jgi:hypothetical protein
MGRILSSATMKPAARLSRVSKNGLPGFGKKRGCNKGIEAGIQLGRRFGAGRSVPFPPASRPEP